MWRKTGLACCILGLALVAGTAETARGDLVIDTYTGWNIGTSTPFNPFGYAPADDEGDLVAIETVGQTFTVGSELTVLENFKFWVNGSPITPIVFNAYVYEWATDKPTGSALYTTTAMTANSGSFQEFSFSPNLQLNASGVYVAFLSATSGVQGFVGARPDNPYNGGSTYYLNNANPSGGSSWLPPNPVITDLVFQASFSNQDVPTIPEPSSWAILGLGCVCMALVRSRRSRLLPHA